MPSILAAFIPLDEFADPLIGKQYGVTPDSETLEILRHMANQRGVSFVFFFSLSLSLWCFMYINYALFCSSQVEVVAKIYYGDPKALLCEAIDKIPLHCLVVGSRGLSKLKR